MLHSKTSDINKSISQEVIYRVSYLAKVREKGYRSQQARDYGATRN